MGGEGNLAGKIQIFDGFAYISSFIWHFFFFHYVFLGFIHVLHELLLLVVAFKSFAFFHVTFIYSAFLHFRSIHLFFWLLSRLFLIRLTHSLFISVTFSVFLLNSRTVSIVSVIVFFISVPIVVIITVVFFLTSLFLRRLSLLDLSLLVLLGLWLGLSFRLALLNYFIILNLLRLVWPILISLIFRF